MPVLREQFRPAKRIGVIGGNQASPTILSLAEKTGRLIADNGHILVCGGMGGVMEAASRGAQQAGGLVIGILPGKSRTDANAYVDIAIPTGLGYLRNGLVILNSDTVIAIDGEYGTLSEIAYGRIYGKPVLGIDTWDIPGVIPVPSPDEALRWIQNHFADQL